MRYIKRALERKFIHMNSFFKAILITGARQVGKTTMLKHLAADSNRTYVTMDNTMARTLAKTDPALFFQTYKPPIIIDEIQKAPELFESIKIICDNSDERGLFWLTGSQQYNMIANIRETMAGRIGILNMYSLSRNEIDDLEFEGALDFSLPCLLNRYAIAPKNNINDTFEYIWRGGMPDILTADEEQRQEYFNSYIETYMMRDIAELGGITDTIRFRKFLAACAALISEQLNYKTLAEAAEISQPTAKEWINILQGIGIIYLLPPYANNALKRLTKKPKLYFTDTGLAAYLSMWLTRDTLMLGAASGHYFENYVVIELVKHFAYAPERANMYYYRDSNAKEIDLVIEQNNCLHPLEIKKAANPDSREIKKFSLLGTTNLHIANGGLICMSEEVIPIDKQNCYIPCNII